MTITNLLKLAAHKLFGTAELVVIDEDKCRSLGGYNRHRSVTAAASKRAAAKRHNLRKRSPH